MRKINFSHGNFVPAAQSLRDATEMETMMKNNGFRILPDKVSGQLRQWSVLVLTLLTVGGMVFCLQGMFEDGRSYLPIAVLVTAASLLSFWMGFSSRNLWIGLACLLVMLIGAGFVLADYLAAGAMNFLNQILAHYNYITGQAVDYFVVPECANMQLAYYCFMAYVIFGLACYIGQLIARRHAIILFLCWLPILAGGLYLQIALGGLVIAWAAVSIAGTFAYSQASLRRDTVYAVTMLVLLFLMGVLGTVYFRTSSYQPSDRIAQLKESVNKRVEHARFGGSDYPEGDLRRQVYSSDEVRLRVELSDEARIYLKGYTGSILEGQKWSGLEPTSYSGEYEGMIKDYVKKGFHPLAQLNCYIQAAGQVTGVAVPQEEITVSVENVSAFRKYTYLPYGISFEDLSGLQGLQQDVNVLSDSGENERATYHVNATKQDAFIGYQGMSWLDRKYDVNEATGSYRVTERDYREFTREHYLEIEEEAQEELEMALPEIPDNLSDITDTIRLLLSQWGQEEKSWSSANYSTTGTMMFRYCGIPARYVEGYLVQGQGIIDVTAADAHAWVEIYKDGVGWIPVDVTPGYYQELPQQEQSSRQQETASGQEAVEQKQPLQQNSAEQDNPFPWQMFLLILLSVLVILLLLFLLVLYLYRQYIWRRRVQEMEQEDILLRMRVLSSYLYELSRYLGRSEEELPENVKEYLAVFWYSFDAGQLLGEQEIAIVTAAAADLQGQAWEAASHRRKWWLRYWKHLEYPV